MEVLNQITQHSSLSPSPITRESALNGFRDFKDTDDLTRDRSFNHMSKSPLDQHNFISLPADKIEANLSKNYVDPSSN